jgi:hypothetical protein
VPEVKQQKRLADLSVHETDSAWVAWFLVSDIAEHIALPQFIV